MARSNGKKAEPKATHGGQRERSGPQTPYPGKVPRPVSTQLTDEGHDILLVAKRNNRIGRRDASTSDIFEGLLRKHGRTLRLPPPADR